MHARTWWIRWIRLVPKSKLELNSTASPPPLCARASMRPSSDKDKLITSFVCVCDGRWWIFAVNLMRTGQRNKRTNERMNERTNERKKSGNLIKSYRRTLFSVELVESRPRDIQRVQSGGCSSLYIRVPQRCLLQTKAVPMCAVCLLLLFPAVSFAQFTFHDV